MAEPMQKALGQAHEALQMFNTAEGNLLMVPSGDTETPWRHLASLDPASPAGAAMRAVGTAWRNGDAAGVSAGLKTLAAELPAMGPSVYPTSKRTIERVYNASRPFDFGLWFYAFALLALLLSFGTQRRWLLWTGIALLVGAIGLHGFGFASRCLIAERFAIQNQFESMTGVSLFAALVGAGLAIFRKQAIFAAAASAVGFLVLIAATQMGIPGYSIEREAAILNTSVLLKYHVTTVLVSYGLISLGMIVSLFYLGTHYFAKAPKAVLAAAGAPVAGDDLGAVSAAALGLEPAAVPATGTRKILADLDAAQMTILQLAFWTLAVGILLGAWWADHSWGRWWAFDPKELWALVTWIVYLVVVHLRFANVRDRGLTTAWLSVLGFIVMLWCYFGVNLLLPGLHAYA
jgi:cytochrome c-type biogenesis protein CcsB